MKPRLALTKDFMAAYSKLPKAQQKKVRDFTEKFRSDPTLPGLNFERLSEARDDKVRSVRIDQEYRAIVVHPPKGDIYLCVWVDHHDGAYAWARNKVFEVNPRSGGFQIFDVEAAEEKADLKPVEQPGLFDGVDDEDLLLAGIPQPLLASVRSIRTEAELDALAPLIPPDAAEMLYYFAAGYDLMTALEEAQRAKPEPTAVDTGDFAAALEKPETQTQIRVVEDEDELEAMLDAPLEQWRIFLHPSQRQLVEMNAKGPSRVLGGAGTGKTVVLMHRARHLARNVFTEDTDRILVTTFTRNLAFDLQTNLKNLCGKEIERIEVTNLHSWAVGFMRRHGHRFKIPPESLRRSLFRQAVDAFGSDEYPESFYLGEWDEVVLEQEVASRDDYLTANRIGRGIPLTRRQRAEVWKVLDHYRRLLDERGLLEWADVVRETRRFIEKGNIQAPYRSVLVDEVQDLSAPALRLLRTIAPHDDNNLFMVGDAHQRIYGKPLALSSLGIEIRGRARRLRMNYRTTAQIRRRAVEILKDLSFDDLDGGRDDLRGYFSLREGPAPEVRSFNTEAQEIAAIVDTVWKWLETVPAREICLATRTNASVKDRYQPALQTAGIETVIVDADSEDARPGVRLATMHRMKGLEFSRVLLAEVREGVLPVEYSGQGTDAQSLEDHLLQERCLLYVAATRARDQLVVTSFGKPSPLLQRELNRSASPGGVPRS